MAGDDSQDDSQKTEDPTQKRLDDARKKGQVVFSREVSTFFILLAFCIILMAITPWFMKRLAHVMLPFVSRPEDIITGPQSLWLVVSQVLQEVGLISAIPFLILVVAAFAAGAAQTRMNVSVERIVPKLEKISILKGFGRLFSMRNLVEFIKGIIKITIVGAVAYIAVDPYMEYLRILPTYDVAEMMEYLTTLSIRIVIGVTLVMFLIAALDYLYQRFEYMKNLRMSKQELKDEYKQQEGDPLVKAKLRQIRVERSKQRMMANVPKSDVVITNPTHYAIALAYDSESMKAPIVLAKGKDKVAARIREIAEEHKIPVFRNPPVARALFDHAELDKEIPLEYYAAVAKIIGYLYKMKGKIPKKRK